MMKSTTTHLKSYQKNTRIEQGFTLIEVLVVLVLSVIGFMGNLSWQQYLNQILKNSAEQSRASQLALSMAERMRNNVEGVLQTAGYQYPVSSPVYSKAQALEHVAVCPCATSLKQAENDIAEWQVELDSLPTINDIKPKGTIELSNSTESFKIYLISVSWPSTIRHEKNNSTKLETISVRVGFNV